MGAGGPLGHPEVFADLPIRADGERRNQITSRSRGVKAATPGDRRGARIDAVSAFAAAGSRCTSPSLRSADRGHYIVGVGVLEQVTRRTRPPTRPCILASSRKDW